MTFYPRGLLAVRASSEKSYIHDLTDAFAQFKASHQGEVKDLQEAVDDLNIKLAAARLGGGGTGAVSDRVYASLGRFAKTGELDTGQGDNEFLNARSRLGVQASMDAGTGPAGGYVVQPELKKEILRRQADLSPMRTIARVMSTATKTLQMPFVNSGMGSGWVGETAVRPETVTPPLSLVEISSGEIYANPAITQQLLDDAELDVGQFLTTTVAEEFSVQEGVAFISGNGTNKPKGLLTYTTATTADAGRAFGTLQYVPSTQAAAITPDSLFNLVFTLRAPYRQRAVWLMNSATVQAVAMFKDTQNRYLFTQSLDARVPSTLLGYPIVVDENMPAIAANALPIAFGDFQRGYVITDRIGIRILRDPYTNKPYVMFYATKRVGGGVLDSNAVKLMKVATT